MDVRCPQTLGPLRHLRSGSCPSPGSQERQVLLAKKPCMLKLDSAMRDGVKATGDETHLREQALPNLPNNFASLGPGHHPEHLKSLSRFVKGSVQFLRASLYRLAADRKSVTSWRTPRFAISLEHVTTEPTTHCLHSGQDFTSCRATRLNDLSRTFPRPIVDTFKFDWSRRYIKSRKNGGCSSRKITSKTRAPQSPE